MRDNPYQIMVVVSKYYNTSRDYQCKRERIRNIGPLTKAIPLKLFLDIAPSSSADITRALRGCS